MTLSELCEWATKLEVEVRQVHALRPPTVAIIEEDIEGEHACLNERTGLPLFSLEETRAFLEKRQQELDQTTAALEMLRKSWEGQGRLKRVLELLIESLGEKIYCSWLSGLQFESIEGDTLKTSVPAQSVKDRIEGHYLDELLMGCQTEFGNVERVEIVVRPPPRRSKAAQERAKRSNAG